jgi:type VI secretion system protein ImpF
VITRIGPEQDLVPSVLDRLIDGDPKVATEPRAGRSQHLAQLKEAVKRDLEWLLNSKQTALRLPPSLPHLASSLLAYGLPDFTPSSLNSDQDRGRLQGAIQEAIRRFEPRLDRVKVTLAEGRGGDRSLRFVIDGWLKVEPAPVPIAFDSELQLHTKAFVVRGD